MRIIMPAQLPINGNLGSAPNMLTMNNPIAPGRGPVNPTISLQANNLGDTVYWLLHAAFDPRTLQNNATTVTNRYTAYTSGYDYLQIYRDYLYRRIFAERPGRNEPDLQTLVDITDNIADIGRMLGIYYTALAMKQSRDPEMFQRARQLELHTTFSEMQTILQYLPCPKIVAQLNAKYIRLMDVSSDDLYQNVGFLVNGDYDAFLQLYANVRARQLALGWMRVLYPELGTLGDNQTGEYNGDVMRAFVNATVKDVATSSTAYCAYSNTTGATEESEMLQSAGILHSVRDVSTGATYTATGWAAPGSGVAGLAAQRTPWPALCRWKTTTSRDAAITRTAATTAYAAGATLTYETVQDSPLSVNLAHEYNMNRDDTNPAIQFTSFTTATGAFGSDLLSAEDTRYRVSAGFSLQSLSFRLDANIMSAMAAFTA